jgi:hypothetical protein
MLTRRAPTHYLVCTIALWVIAGFLPDQEAHGAKLTPSYHQQENVTGGSPASERNISSTFTLQGDPDEFAHSDTGTPTHGGGSPARQGTPIIQFLLDCVANWWLMVTGFPPQ